MERHWATGGTLRTLGLNLSGIGRTTGGTLRNSEPESVGYRGDDWRDTQGFWAESVVYRGRLEGLQGFWSRVCRV